MPASALESNLATTRGQMIDLEERMGTQEARQMAHATSRRTRERPDARDTSAVLRVCAPHGRFASSQISRACGTRQPLETGSYASQPVSNMT